MSLNDRLDPDERLHVCIQSVRHKFKLAVWRNERDGTIVVEPRQTDALVELNIFQLHRLALTTAGALKQHLQQMQ